LKAEAAHYEKIKKFKAKIREAKGEAPVASPHASVIKFLSEKMLDPGMSILELGCAAGVMLKLVKQAYVDGIGGYGDLVGVELVQGWVDFARSYFTDIKVFQGDVT
jgi:hypothetical protein